MNAIFNLTQHAPTPEQAAAGVLQSTKEVQDLLTFKSLPSREEIWTRADALVGMVKAAGFGFPSGTQVMVGGAPYLMAPLVEALKNEGFKPVFSFTERVSVEKDNGDGTVTKTNVFKHVGWVEAA